MRGFFCSQVKSPEIAWKKKKNKITRKSSWESPSLTQMCLYPAGILFAWVNISMFKPHVVLLLSGQQGCKMFVNLLPSSWQQWEGCWRSAGARIHGGTESTKTTCWSPRAVAKTRSKVSLHHSKAKLEAKSVLSSPYSFIVGTQIGKIYKPPFPAHYPRPTRTL